MVQHMLSVIRDICKIIGFNLCVSCGRIKLPFLVVTTGYITSYMLPKFARNYHAISISFMRRIPYLGR